MRVKAEHWVNYNGNWYRPGEEYDTGSPVADIMKPDAPAEKEEQPEQPAKRGRKAKAKE